MFRFCDSFDHYDTARIPEKWTATINSGITIDAAGRNGKGMKFDRSGIGIMPLISKTLDYRSTWIVGFAFYNSGGPGLPGGVVSSVYNNFQLMGQVTQENDGTLTLKAGSHTIINASAFPLQENVWYYIEIKYVVGTSCAITLKINGSTVAAGVDIIQGFDANQAYATGANRLVFGGCGPVSTVIDDLYICDNQAGLDNFIGDVAIACIYPRADVFNDFSPSTPGDHYPLVKEHNPDDDTSYVQSNTIGALEKYYFDTVASFSGTIPAVHLNIYTRKDDEGYRAFKSVGVVQNAINASRYINDSYNYQSFPDDASGWTVAAVNGTAFGAQIVDVS